MIAAPDLAQTLTRLVALAHSRTGTAPWERPVDEDTVEQMRATLFLLDSSGDGADVATFVGEHLDQVITQLRRTTEIRSRELRGRVSGMVDWPSTMAARLVHGGNPTYFICRDSEFYYDTPENQLLFFLVEQIERSLAIVPWHVRAGLIVGPHGAAAASPQLELIAEGLRRFRRATVGVRVTLPRVIGHEHVGRAERAALPSYRVARAALGRWERMTASQGWRPLFEAASRALPIPVTLDPEDPWLSLAASVLSRRAPPGRSSAAPAAPTSDPPS